MPDSKADKRPDADQARKEERERLLSIQTRRPGVATGEDIWDLSSIRHAHKRRGGGR